MFDVFDRECLLVSGSIYVISILLDNECKGRIIFLELRFI
jgi:hypothetical protein